MKIKILYKIVSLVVTVILKIDRNYDSQKILKSYLMLIKNKSRNIKVKSEDTKKILIHWFETQKIIDQQINLNCNYYYKNKHPKHYLWLGHNQYLFDGIKEGERVLDIGCGGSYYQQWIAEKASQVVGVDILPERVELSRKNNQKSNVTYQVMDITKELPSNQFDVVICSHVIEHLEDPISVLESLARKIPRLIIKVPLEDSHWMKLVKKDIGMFWLDDRDHRREYTEELLKKHLEDSGWLIQEMIRGYDLRAKAISKYCFDNKLPVSN